MFCLLSLSLLNNSKDYLIKNYWTHFNPSMATEDHNPITDDTYEFSAPRYLDFINGESEEETERAELWFETAVSYAPSTFMPRINMGRSVPTEILCNFSDVDHPQKASGSSDTRTTRLQSELVPAEATKEEELHQCEEENRKCSLEEASAAKQSSEDKDGVFTKENPSVVTGRSFSIETGKESEETTSSVVSVILETCTPRLRMISRKEDPQPTNSKKNQHAKMTANLVRSPSVLKSKNESELSQDKSIIPTSSRSMMSANITVAAVDFSQGNQAIKRQKLEGGRSRQILDIKSQNFPHKSRPALTGGATNLCSSFMKTCKEGRQDDATSITQRKPELTLTRPKEHEFETAHCNHSLRVRSTAEFEEEMMANIPKFKSWLINKKEFHLKTTERAYQNAKTSSVVSSTESSCQNQGKPQNKLTEPRTPRLETSLRARPPKVKSFQELEQEELERMPKFKARPFNKKIFESKGDLGMFRSVKRNVTKPQEFHFATEERIPPPAAVVEIFDKIPPKPEPKKCTQPKLFQLESLVKHEEEAQMKMEKSLWMEKEEAQMRIFKAQPIMKDEPLLVPVKTRKPLTQVQEFVEVNRSEFNKKKIRENEMIYKREESESAKMMNKEKEKQLRTMVPHAKPMPNFDNHFHSQKSCKETKKPESLKRRIVRRKDIRQMVGGATAVSSAASHMR